MLDVRVNVRSVCNMVSEWNHITKSGKRILVNGQEKDLIIDGIHFELKVDTDSIWMIRRKAMPKEKRCWEDPLAYG